MAETEGSWRRGAQDYKRRHELWAAKAEELHVDKDYLMGWWKSIKDWYVRLKKTKSGQGVKKHTDREKYILDKVSFYQSQLVEPPPEPMTQLPRHQPQPQPQHEPPRREIADRPSTPPGISDEDEEDEHRDPAQGPLPLEPNLEEDTDEEATLSQLETSAAEAARQQVPVRARQRKRKRQEQLENNWLKEMQDSMKSNAKLLSDLLDQRPAQSNRDPFINYVSDTLRNMPAHQYQEMKIKITALLRGTRPPHNVVFLETILQLTVVVNVSIRGGAFTRYINPQELVI